MESHDFAVVGAGIVGLATTLALNRRQPAARIVVLDKERAVAAHQTGHNSGVIHSGIYYKPGSLKAQLCVRGAELLRQFCTERAVPFDDCGKVIVATEPDELPRLQTLHERSLANGVPGVTRLTPEVLREREPHAAGLAALYSPHTGIVDYKAVADAMRAGLEQRGVEFRLGWRVNRITSRDRLLWVETSGGEVSARYLVNCAGLYSDQVARLMGLATDVRIVPFRGEYYMVKPERRALVRGLIYPVPDPRFPFLGVHFTRTIHGDLEAGPNAVLAFAREGYAMRHLSLRELSGMLVFGGFWKMAVKYWRIGVGEFYRSFSKRAFIRSLQRLVPDIRDADAERGGAGVRAQAIDGRGALVDDFRLSETSNSLHVLNAPSPAATASLAIGEYIAARIPA